MPKFAAYQPIYDVTQRFVDRCLLGNRSLLWLDQVVWTQANVQEAKRRIVDQPIIGANLSFTEKLKLQMQGAPPELWMLVADIQFIYCLPSTSLTVQGKRAAIRWTIEQGGLASPDVPDNFWDALGRGFARTALRYHMKHAQFSLILRLADALKNHWHSHALLGDHRQFYGLLNSLLAAIPNRIDQAWDMRNALLYMIFPEHYEPILSNADKRAIVSAYHSLLGQAQLGNDDEVIERIRTALSPRFTADELPFSFYGSLKDEWKGAASAQMQLPTVAHEAAEDENPISEPSSSTNTIFISYRRDDSADTTGRIYDWLVKEFTEEAVFKDVDSIPLGVNFKTHISEIVSQCRILLAIIGSRWISIADQAGNRRLDHPGDFVRIEIASALARKIIVIPVYVQDAKPVSASDLPDDMQELGWLQGISVRRDPDFKRDMEKLIKELRKRLT